MKRNYSWDVGQAAAVVTATLALGACHVIETIEEPGTKPVPFSDAIHQLQLDVSKVKVVVPSDLLFDLPNSGDPDSWKSDDRAKKILGLLADNQCYAVDPATGKVATDPRKFRTRNPLIPVLTGPLQLTVQGQLSESGTLTVSVTPSAGGTVARQAQQQIMFPMTLVSLETLPTFYMGQQMSNIQNITVAKDFYSDTAAKAKADKEQIDRYVSSIMTIASRLTSLTGDAFNLFDHDLANYCNGRDSGGWTPVGAAAAPP